MMTNSRAFRFASITIGTLWTLWALFMLIAQGSLTDIVIPMCMPALAVLMFIRHNVHDLENGDLALTFIPGLLVWLGVFFCFFKAATKRMK
jgi:hypothetical protein